MLVYQLCVFLSFDFMSVQEMRVLDKEARVWDVYVSLDCVLGDLLASLRAVTELLNPAMRDRHWAQLVRTTGVRKRVAYVQYKCYLF